MENQELNSNIILNIQSLEEKCIECNEFLIKTNVYLLFDGYNSSRWQKEKIGYCENCNKYYISELKKEEFFKKYPRYQIKEQGKIINPKISELTLYLLTKNKKHSKCFNSKRTIFIEESVILEDKHGNIHKTKIKKCLNCGFYYAKLEESMKFNDMVKKLILKSIPEKNIINHNYKSPNKAGIPTQLGTSSILNIVHDNKCINHDIINMNFNVGFMLDEKTRVMKQLNGFFCKDCDMYIVDYDEFKSKSIDKQVDCNIFIDYEKKSLNYISDKADFFVRTNIIDCVNKHHDVIDVIGEIDVIDKMGTIARKEIPAYYCRNCNLFFIYNSEYEKIRKIGIPLSPIYEYSKYTMVINNKYNLSQESLLHSCGYNVGAIDNLSDYERRKILLFIIENGIMDKHKIIYLLNHFIDMRKNNHTQINAIRKWKSDIDFLKNKDIKILQHVKISAIKIKKRTQYY